MTSKKDISIHKPSTAQNYALPIAINKFHSLSPDFPSIPKPITPNLPISSPYITKKHHEHLLLTTFTTIPDYKTLTTFISKIIPNPYQWIPEDLSKTQKFYELILVDSGSIELYHTMDRTSPDRISYSKCIIKKIIPPNEWTNFLTEKPFSVNFLPKGFTYHDYRMAWYRTFLYRPFDHSWFITFHTNCGPDFPIWFYEWWYSYGPTTDILPPTILKAYNLYLFKATGPQYFKQIQFYREFKVPWIFCWSFKVTQFYNPVDNYPLSLLREYKIKWWDKFSLDYCTEQIVSTFLSTGKKQQVVLQTIPSSTEVLKKDLVLNTGLPTTTPAQSSAKKPIQLSDSDSDDDLKMFLAFQKFRKMHKKHSKSDDSVASSPAGQHVPIGGHYSQDPFDDVTM